MENFYVPNPNSSSPSSPNQFQFQNPTPSPSMIPNFLGCRFVPYDDELIHHLHVKKANPTDYSHYPMITDFNVYEDEPACLPWDPSMNSMFKKDQRFFFVQQSGKKAVRTVSSGKGWWNTNSEKVIYNDQKQVIGFMKTLTYFQLKEEEKTKESRKRKERNSEEEPKKSRKEKGIKTDWIMHEYALDKSKDQDWVLCQIHYNNKNPAPLITFPAADLPLIEASPTPTTPSSEEESTALTCLSNGGGEEEPNNPKRLKTTTATGVVEESDGCVAAAAREDDLADILNNLEQIVELDDDWRSSAEDWDVFGLVDLLKKPMDEVHHPLPLLA